MLQLSDAVTATYEAGIKLANNPVTLEKLNRLYYTCGVVVSHGLAIGVAGNGGSAAEAEHFVAELTGRFLVNRPGLPAINLNSNLAELTAISNDFGYTQSISRNVDTFSNICGVFIFLTTSGNSENVKQAMTSSSKREKWLLTSDKCQEDSPYIIKVPSIYTPTIQEVHLQILHWLAGRLESTMGGNREA